MKVSNTILSNVLLAGAALAVPSQRKRSARGLSGSPISKVDGSAEIQQPDGNVTQVEYSSNWSGVVIETPPSGTTWKSVTSKFTVPTPSKGSGSAGSTGWSASAWVGIDGDTCSTAILQTGVDFSVSSSGAVSYDAWYEWYPDYAYDFTGITFSAGDVVQITVTAATLKSGTAVIENITKGKTVTKSISSSASLCGENAEWIVEDFEEGNALVPFANFGTVDFTGAVATTSSGSTEGPNVGTIIDIKSGNTVYTSVTVPSSSELVVKYV